MAQPSILELVGRIDNVTSEDIEARINGALDGKPSALILDFTNITFVSSVGIRVLLMAAKRCRRENIALALHSIAPQIVELFRVSSLEAFLPIYDSREKALAATAI